MTILTRDIDYDHDGLALDGQLAWDDAVPGPRPGVLVVHAWGGRSAFEDGKARRLAELGYAGFAADLYGKGVRGGTKEQNAALIQPFLDDRDLLQRRLAGAVETLRAQPEVDAGKIAAIGFCFGGLSVLDLARSGADIAGVVSFHGLLGKPGNTDGNRVRARVLALHGWDDPMATPEQALGFADEMTTLGADWQIHAYGHTMHAFTNPQASDPDFGTVFSEAADRRSWAAMREFLAECFG